MNEQGITLIDQAKRYLEQQADLYGDALVLDDVHILKNARQKKSKTGSFSLSEFDQQINTCQACALGATRNAFVFGEGNPNANLMLIGEAPGEEEDKLGRPFVGSAGQLLDKILAAVEFKRDEVYICNILKCRPPENRDPALEEIEQCVPYLKKQIEIIQPQIIMALGRVAGQVLLNQSGSLAHMREKVHQYQNIPVLVTYHPAALLRNPQWKRPVWEDVQKMRRLYDETVGDKPTWQPLKKS